MDLTRLAGTCPDGATCPTIFTTDRGTIVIQGPALTGAGLSQADLPDGEAAVEIPLALLLEAARAYRA
jgi:hypothetical protein